MFSDALESFDLKDFQAQVKAEIVKILLQEAEINNGKLEKERMSLRRTKLLENLTLRKLRKGKIVKSFRRGHGYFSLEQAQLIVFFNECQNILQNQNLSNQILAKFSFILNDIFVFVAQVSAYLIFLISFKSISIKINPSQFAGIIIIIAKEYIYPIKANKSFSW